MKPHSNLAIHLSGGGARAAYQVGLLRCLGKHHPDLRFLIVTGISAGAINAVCLAAHPGPLGETAERLRRLWCGLEVEKVFRVDSLSLGGKLLRWGWRLVSGGGALAPEVRGLTDTRPLRRYLESALELEPTGEICGIARNLEEGRLRALALAPATSPPASPSPGSRAATWRAGSDRGAAAGTLGSPWNTFSGPRPCPSSSRPWRSTASGTGTGGSG